MTKISNLYALTSYLTADLVNNRIGINTASPTTLLDVNGTGRFAGDVTFEGGTGAINFTASTTITNTASSGFTAIYANGGGIYLGGSASVNHLSIASGGAATFTSSVTAGSTITATAPSNGIGLQINGRSSDNIGQMLFYANNGTTLQNYLQSRPAYFSINTETNTPIYLNTNVGGAGGTVMTLTGGGNVGIGTTSPSSTLHILKTAAYNVINDQLIIQGGPSGGNPANPAYYGGIRITTGDYDWMAIRAIQTSPVSSWTNRVAFFGMNGAGGSLVERMCYDFSGNVGIGLTNPQTQLQINGVLTFSEAGFDTVRLNQISSSHSDGNSANNNLRFLVSNGAGATSERMRINGLGNVGIGTTAPDEKLTIGSGNGISIRTVNSGVYGVLKFGTTNATFYDAWAGIDSDWEGVGVNVSNLRFYTSFGDRYERMRITSGGFLKASNTGTYLNSTGNFHEIRSNSGNSYSCVIQHSSSTLPYGLGVFFTGASPNSTNFEFIYAEDTTQSKFIVWSNGSVINRTGSYGTISDVKFKENIVDATPKLGDIAKLKVRNFNLKGESTKQIGFIAQEFEEVFPNMVDVSTERGTDGETYKSIKTSVLVPMLVKAIQELSAKVTALENK
jgi:Protein involved in vacuole import and degradation